MAIRIWAFKDATGTVRVTSNDPSSVLGASPHFRQVAKGESPGGFSMRDIRKFFQSTEETLAGQSGLESFVEFKLHDLDTDMLTALMTPIPEPEPEPEP